MTKPRTVDASKELTLQARRDFLKLPIEERRRRMEEQAARIARYYGSKAAVKEREAWQGGDIVEPN